MNARAFPDDMMPVDDHGIAQLRVPPHSIEAEAGVLGALLLDGSAWDRVGDLLTEGDFYRHEHRLVFSSVAALANANKTADVITVSGHLQSIGKAEEVGGMLFLSDLAQYVPGAGNLRRYAEIVRERAVLRKLIAVSDEIAASAFNTKGKDAAAVLDDAMQKVLGISPETSTDEWESMDQIVVQELDLIQDRADGDDTERPADYIATGLSALDDLLDGGLRAGQLIIVGARPGMGKTAIADTIGVNVARRGLPVGKFSMEMQNQEGGQRALSNVGRIPLHMLRRPKRMSQEHWSSLSAAVEELRGIPFYSNDKGGLNINQVRAKARALKRRHGLRLLIVDYLQLMSGTDSRSPRTYQLEEASRGLKALAKELGVPVIALVQVNRGVEKETDPMPRPSDIKDCGAIEQDADVIAFIHRPIVSTPDLADEWKYYAKVSVAKQRGGRTGLLDLMYVGENTRFGDWPASLPIPTSLARTERAARTAL